MVDVKLYGTPNSRTARCVWMLEELGIPYESDPIRHDDSALKRDPFLALNPNGRIPTLVVDGQPIFESLAINLYLAQRFPSALSLGTTELQAQAVQWSLWAQSDVDPTIVAWFLNTHFLPPEKCNAALAAGALEALAKPMGVLERALASREWLLDDRFTVADLNVASTLYLAQKWNLPRPPRLGEWLQRCWSRPAAVKSRKLRGEAI